MLDRRFLLETRSSLGGDSHINRGGVISKETFSPGKFSGSDFRGQEMVQIHVNVAYHAASQRKPQEGTARGVNEDTD